jgi:predicted N-acetyltransferase YhbS
MPIEYRTGNDLSLDQFIDLLVASTLGERRPVHNREVMKGMLENGSLMVTAWDGEKLVGISRTLTDFANVAYLADLAVHLDYQRQGIGTVLVEKTREAMPATCSIVLLSAPLANEYYPKIGFKHNPRAWTMPSREKA